jgi:hypothetical protein
LADTPDPCQTEAESLLDRAIRADSALLDE